MKQLNQKIVNWLEQDKFYEALVGEGEFFLRDYGNPNYHDVMLVVYVLVEWAFQQEDLEKIAKNFENGLIKICDVSPEKCMDIILAYAIHAKDLKKKLPCNFTKVFKKLNNQNNVNTVRINDLIKRLKKLN